MLKKQVGVLAAIICSSIVFCSCGTQTVQMPDIPEVTGAFETKILKVGQADAIVLTTEHHSVVIDCGEQDDGDEVIKYLKEEGIAQLEYLFITHFDKDHVGGVPEVLGHIPVGKVFVPDYESETAEYKVYKAKLDELGMKDERVTDTMELVLDDVLLRIYPPEKNFYEKGDNDYSLAITANHGANSFLFTGDAIADRTDEVIRQCRGEYTFLKVPHHGKYNKNTKKLIDVVKPKYAAITDSDKNKAEDKTVAALEAVPCRIYYSRNGDISVLSDGNNLTIQQ